MTGDELIARSLFARFCPGGQVGGKEWQTLLHHVVPSKAEADYITADWRRVQSIMRRTLAEFPHGYPEAVTIDPCPYCVWYANAHGFPAE